MTDPVLFLQDLAVILLSASLCGYLCRRIGLSPVVGYLTAGLIVGTPDIAFPYVTDEQRIAIIAQLGVVFLMFSIGLQFRLRRIRELGLRVILSTTITALLVLSAVRLSADIIGLSAAAGVALAAVFMNSSSAIISKIIQESGLGHERHGQLALGTTLLEDIVAVVMLAVIGSYVAIEGVAQTRQPIEVIALLIGFAVVIFILGILFLPKLLLMVGRGGNSEAISILVAGTMLSSSLIAVAAGYSLALGAFLCGMVIAETREKSLVERSFQGLKDIFLTIFFVTIGMMVDIHAIPGAIQWILLGTAGAVLGRSLAAFVAFLLVGEQMRTASRAALCLTPLGEFSFIIAGVAVTGGLFSENFQVAVVGTVLGTSLLSPLIASNGQRLTTIFAEGRLPILDRLHGAYSEFWRFSWKGQEESTLWPPLKKRLIHIVIELIVVSTILVFAGRFFTILESTFPEIFLHPSAHIGFWSVLVLMCLIPVIAIWRNISAISQLLMDYLLENKIRSRRQLILFSGSLQVTFVFLFALWLWNMLPTELPQQLILAAAVLTAALVIALAWQYFSRIQSEVALLLDRNLSQSDRNSSRYLFDNWQDEEWNLNVQECIIPDDSSLAGVTLRNLALRKTTGCSIVGIQRHGHAITDIGPATHLFPGDELLLLGSVSQIEQAQKMLSQTDTAAGFGEQVDNQIMKSLKVPTGSPVSGKRLGELNWSRDFGVQVVAMKRGPDTLTGIDAETIIKPADLLLLLGKNNQLNRVATEVLS
jgi:CPA2 family monovalent cation:H+ antiporter-2